MPAAFLPSAPPGFRAVPLDGAMLYFEPRTGTHVRVANAATHTLRRAAPRVVMFGITNACNLRCDFCSRDAAAPSRWTVATAVEALRGLATAGVLEVAFGGGEPMAFPGFAEMVTELRRTTSLALHLTTNGTLVTPARWAALADGIGMARLSIYAEVPWHGAADTWRDHGQRWGANLLVDDDALVGLPTQLAELAARGAHDVSILTYVGARRQLSDLGGRRLAALLADAPLPVRLSVCAGGRLPLPRLFDGADGTGDCGAGHDFVTVTPDQRLLACSFGDDTGTPARTADEILAGWRTQQVRLAQPSRRDGCARVLPLAHAPVAPPPVAIWRAFAGNNSGECVMVARFATPAAAEAVLAELLPGWIPDAPWSDAWIALLAEAQVASPAQVDMPKTLLTIGASLLALGYDADDQFAELRHLAWRRDADAVTGEIHAHDPLELVAVIRTRDADAAHSLATRARGDQVRAWTHGRDAVLAVAVGDELPARKAWLEALAADAPLAVDLLEAPTDVDMLAALQRLGVELPILSRVQISFTGFGEAPALAAAQFAATLRDQPATVVGRVVLIEPVARPRRLAVLAARAGGSTHVLHGRDVTARATFWIDEPPRQKGVKATPRLLDTAAIEHHAHAVPALRDATASSYRERYVTVEGTTAEPATVLRAHAAFAAAHDLRLNVGFVDLAPLGWVLRTLLAEVAARDRHAHPIS